jgi:hypothetical protein
MNSYIQELTDKLKAANELIEKLLLDLTIRNVKIEDLENQAKELQTQVSYLENQLRGKY